jgi:hypothetical protein
MPSFLSKVFGRKKDESPPGRQRRTSQPSLLDGKYEAVSPTVSPSATRFPELSQKNGDSSNGYGRGQRAPHLSLHLPGRNERAVLEDVFEGDVPKDVMLSDEVIGARRLSVDELLPLVQACTKHISEKGTFLSCAIVSISDEYTGLETLGIMHPHWHSASPSLQRKLISLYLYPLAAPGSSSPTPSSFQNELDYSDPRDVAAVLRWAIRHFEPKDSPAFGGDSAYSWYSKFSRAERDQEYPTDAFNKSLSIPSSHLQLLSVILDLTSLLGAHAETNGISGSKFSKLVGHWLLENNRKAIADDWRGFYADWDKAGRILEHLFLARIRWVNSAYQTIIPLIVF